MRTFYLILFAIVMTVASPQADARTESDAERDFGLYLTSEREAVPLPVVKTEVRGVMRGFVARVNVTQIFVNPFSETIEATYVFPLSQNAAVHTMEMLVDGRRIVAEIQPREVAERTYRDAVARGHTASLLTQERANVFTEHVGNIPPGQAIEVRLSYVEALPFEAGRASFSFPTVVGPRFVPGAPRELTNIDPYARQRPTRSVPDADRITPPALGSKQSTDHRIDLELEVDPGRVIRFIHSPSHALDLTEHGSRRATVRIAPGDRELTKDFILHLDLRGKNPSAAVLAHRDEQGDGYATLVIQPPRLPAVDQVSAKDLFFVVDTSGSMSGKPLDAAKLLIETALAGMNPNDRFTVMRFSDSVSTLSATPLTNTAENTAAAIEFVRSLSGGGGTQMISGVRRALEGRVEPGRIRIVFFLTDGYIGNDAEIMAAVHNENTSEARLFSLGVGSSVNRGLLAGMARAGRGEMQVMRHDEQPGPFVERFYRRVRNPVLTNVTVDWGTLAVHGATPEIIPDVFDGQPMLLHARYRAPGHGTVTVRGKLGTIPFEQQLEVTLPERAEQPAIAKLWARAFLQRYDDQEASCPGCFKHEITKLALEHELMSRYTAFVAVEEERHRRQPSEPLIPVAQQLPLPEGVSRAALGELSRRQIPPGDPIISIAAPSDAKRVTAYFPFGLVKELHYDNHRHLWRGRFLVPAGIADGNYTVRVVIELSDGTTRVRLEPFTLDSQTEDFEAFFTGGADCQDPSALRRVNSVADTMLELNVDAIEPAMEVYAHSLELGWDRIALQPIDDEHILWDALMVVDSDVVPGAYEVLVVVRDAAGNRLTQTLEVQVLGRSGDLESVSAANGEVFR